MNGTVDSRSLHELNGIGIKEVLEQDPRPTFVLDLDPDDLDTVVSTDTLNPLFCNEALRSHHLLLGEITGDSEDAPQFKHDEHNLDGFRVWATSVTKFDDSRDVYPLTYLYQGMLWTGSTVRRRWRLISGNQCYQLPAVPVRDLSSGPPAEISTGGYAFEQASQRSAGGRVTTTKSHSHSPGLQAFLTQSLTEVKTDENTDTTGTIVNSERQQLARTKLGKRSSRSSSYVESVKSPSLFITLTAPEDGVPDWTVPKPHGVLSDHVIFTRSIDWASTSLGAMKTWSRELRQAANLVMGNPHPACLFWGNEMTMLYNEAYKIEVAGNKHPLLMGTGFAGPFHETWEAIAPLFQECARTGKSIRKQNQELLIERFGYPEETFFSWSFTPLYGGTNRIVGFYNAPFETTIECIGQRRMQTLQRLGQVVTLAKTIKEFWKFVLLGLEDNHFDVPFALLYSVTDSEDGDDISISSGSTVSLKSCIFEGSIAVPDGHPAALARLDLKRSREGFIPSFREAMRTREPTKLQTRDGTLPEALLEGIDWRGFEEPCKEAIIFPVRPTNGESVMAFLLLGVNPRRAYDEEYKAFTTMMNRQLATALASVMLFEEEMRRNRTAIQAAALEQELLNEQLAVQTNRLQRMTALSPLGMFYINAEGLILEANDRYYEMTSQKRETLTEMGWMDQLVEKSKQTMADGWKRMTIDLLPWSAELQLAKKWKDPQNPNAELIDYWVLANSQPELTPDGKLRSVMGSITDISHLKWGQGMQDRRLREAEETRRQQNEFIDITSHEMRNPLSAILQCADDIISTMTEYQASGSESIASLFENCIESATTIALCVQHQKSIVDDILTVSKLDSNLLMLTPIAVQPIDVVRRAVKMFDSELLAKRIDYEFIVHPSFKRFNVEWVSMDPSRMSQIVINFMTNAIKFTNDRPKRKITVSIGVSLHTPVPTTPDFHYIPKRNAKPSTALGDDWTTGEAIYIRLKVNDTGCGLTPEEKQLLFQRFQQASPRTHAQYGGSGLGLFISRQLTELHGGQIGVASEAGVGSTFGFYIRTRRASPPEGHIPETLLPPEHFWPSKPKLSEIPAAAHEIPEILKPDSKSIPGPVVPIIKQQPKIEQPKLHILVVEDNIVNQKVLVKQLQKAGCIVSVADNGQLALDYLETTEFRKTDGRKLSVVLMDLEMPIMDGLTCVKNIRKMETEGAIQDHVPVIAVTANVRQEQVAAAKQSGMDDIVSKPFRIPELLTKVNSLLSQLNTSS